MDLARGRAPASGEVQVAECPSVPGSPARCSTWSHAHRGGSAGSRGRLYAAGAAGGRSPAKKAHTEPGRQVCLADKGRSGWPGRPARPILVLFSV